MNKNYKQFKIALGVLTIFMLSAKINAMETNPPNNNQTQPTTTNPIPQQTVPPQPTTSNYNLEEVDAFPTQQVDQAQEQPQQLENQPITINPIPQQTVPQQPQEDNYNNGVKEN